MKAIAAPFIFLLLTATSAGTLADNPNIETHDVRTGLSVDRSPTASAMSSTPTAQAPKSAEPRKQKRCRQYFKTVGIACKKRALR